jgi:pyruvate/2-oxoglutarate/acetoin dehydrogenase E1 component
MDTLIPEAAIIGAAVGGAGRMRPVAEITWDFVFADGPGGQPGAKMNHTTTAVPGAAGVAPPVERRGAAQHAEQRGLFMHTRG